jgi:hypothetical protein
MKLARFYRNPIFPDVITRFGLLRDTFACRVNISFSTMELVHPDLHPGRRGGMQRRTAWRIAQAYATIAGIESEDAFHLLIVEHPTEPSPDSGAAL